jgi:CheY-like chemotaxis protein
MKEIEGNRYLLYAEDDADDQLMLSEIMSIIDPGLPVVAVENGFKVMEYLLQLGDDQALPCCIILDLNMPVWDGLRTLKMIKEEGRYKRIPVCMFTSSSNPRDKLVSKELGAEAFFTKPFKREELMAIGKRFNSFCE